MANKHKGFVPEEMREQQMFCFFAPDGVPQLSTLSDQFAEVFALVEMMAMHGLSKNVNEMHDEGFKVLPVSVTILATGSEVDAFRIGKQQIKDDEVQES